MSQHVTLWMFLTRVPWHSWICMLISFLRFGIFQPLFPQINSARFSLFTPSETSIKHILVHFRISHKSCLGPLKHFLRIFSECVHVFLAVLNYLTIYQCFPLEAHHLLLHLVFACETADLTCYSDSMFSGTSKMLPVL